MTADPQARPTMTPREAMTLEKRWPAQSPAHQGRKVAELRERYGLSLTRYHQLLNRWLDDPEFVALDPAHARLLRSRRGGGARYRRRAAVDD